MLPGWLPTIMAGPAQPCPQRGEAHQGCPRSGFGALLRTARALRPEAGLDLVPGDGAVLCDLSAGGVGGLISRSDSGSASSFLSLR